MDEDRFWELIDELRICAQHAVPRMRRLLTRHLAQMTDSEVAGFADRWHEVYGRADCWPLWQAVLVAFGGSSDDAFMDVRCWLICQGQSVYTAVLDEPDGLLEHVGPGGQEVFGDAEAFASVIWDEYYGRPGIRHADHALPTGGPMRQGIRIDLSDRDAVFAHFPRCAAAWEEYLAAPLPDITVAVRPGPEQPSRLRALALGATWRSRRDKGV